LPVEWVIESSQKVHDTVARMIKANIAEIADGLFGLHSGLDRSLNGTRPDEVLSYMDRETERFTTVREQEEESRAQEEDRVVEP
jgi:hypothetical protein